MVQMAQSEGRIALALHAYQQGQFSSLRAAARTYDVPYVTLTRRYQGTFSRSNCTPYNRKLTQTEETTLVNWILDIDTRGVPSTQALVKEMAEILLMERV
jgi:hypothetical protein